MTPLLRARRLWQRVAAPERPLAALEIRPGSVACLRVTRERGRPSLGAAAVVELEAGVVPLSLAEPDAAGAEALRAAVKGAAQQAGLAPGARVALVLPDALARVVLIPLPEAKAGTSLEELVRFRLRRTLPFDVRDASVAVESLAAVAGAEPALLAAVIAAPVLRWYESALEAAGLRPGLVELSGLALLRHVVSRPGDRLLLNWDTGYLTLALLRQGRPLLLRTLQGEPAGGAAVGRELERTLLYYRDRLGGGELSGAELRLCGPEAEAAAPELESLLGVVPERLAPWAALGAALPHAGAARLAGAAASLLSGERVA